MAAAISPPDRNTAHKNVLFDSSRGRVIARIFAQQKLSHTIRICSVTRSYFSCMVAEWQLCDPGAAEATPELVEGRDRVSVLAGRLRCFRKWPWQTCAAPLRGRYISGYRGSFSDFAKLANWIKIIEDRFASGRGVLLAGTSTEPAANCLRCASSGAEERRSSCRTTPARASCTGASRRTGPGS
jgi:hypothetical protein